MSAMPAAVVSSDPLRNVVLGAARRFKSTWVELGKLLVQVRDEAKFEEWGYASFEAYCSKELHLRKATADKLVRSFSFLARHEPKVREADEEVVRAAPAFEVVEVLADAEQRGQLSAAEYKSIRDSIWDPESQPSALKRDLIERFPKPPPPPQPDELQLRRLAQAARKLASDLSACKSVSRAVAERAAALADDVEEASANLRTK